MSPPAGATSLAQLGPDDFEFAAGTFIARRLSDRGPPPYSICEARLGEVDYLALQMWAQAVSPSQLNDGLGYGGLVFFTLVSEYNRRHSPGDEVWPGIADLFQNAKTHARMFDGRHQPRELVRERIVDTTARFRLRHVFDEMHEETQRWYLTIQLQYGWSLAQLEHHLPDWLGGHPVPESMRRLLDPAGRYRSRSFQQVFRDLQYFRRGYLTEPDLRRTLTANSWVLPDWTENLIRWSRKKGEKPPIPPEDPQHELLESPSIDWDTNGPHAVCRTRGPGAHLTDSGSYHLRHEDRILNSWFRRRDGSYFADRDEVCLPLDSPQAVIRLEDSAGECVAVQTAQLWDPTCEVQAFLPGRAISGPINLDRGSACILMMHTDYAVSMESDEWCLVGRKPHQRRWVFLSDWSTDLHVRDRDGHLAWQSLVTASPPWARVRVDFDADNLILSLGDKVGFRFATGPGINIEYACCNGLALNFLTAARTKTERIRLTPEHAAAGFDLRIGLEHAGHRAILREHVTVPVQGVVVEDDGEWKSLPSDDTISTTESTSNAFRLFTTGPKLLMEGNTVHRRLGDRPGSLGRLLGTGGPIRVVDVPYTPSQDIRIAAYAIDFGVVLNFHLGGENGCLELHRAMPPRAGHQLVVWSSRHGLCCIDYNDIGCENDGRVWRFKRPWPDESEAFLCGVAFEGYRLGFGWSGQWHRFFSVDLADNPGLDARQRFALIRWFRLPGLLVNKFASVEPMVLEHKPNSASLGNDQANTSANAIPILQPLAIANASDLLAVALFGQGLEELPSGIKLAFEESVDEREQFDVTVIELLFDYQPTVAAAELIRNLFQSVGEMVNRLFAFHPLLGARILYGVWVRSIKPQAKFNARQDLRGWWRAFAGVPPNGNYSDETRRRQNLREQAEKALSEGTGPGLRGIMPEIEKGTLRAVFHDQRLNTSKRANLLVALGAGDFRYYLGLRLLDELEHRL